MLSVARHTWAEIRDKLDCNDAFVDRRTKCIAAKRLASLSAHYAEHAPVAVTPQLEERIPEWTVKRQLADGATQWSTRRLAQQQGVSDMIVARVRRTHALRTRRPDGQVTLDDPEFPTKAAEIIGLYLDRPQQNALLCAAERTMARALDRPGPALPMSLGRAERNGFECFRRRTLLLSASSNTKIGEVLGKTASRYTSAEFVGFLTDICVSLPRGKEIYVIADNSSAQQAAQGAALLAACPRVQLHFTPPYSTLLNQGELWLAKIERDGIAQVC